MVDRDLLPPLERSHFTHVGDQFGDGFGRSCDVAAGDGFAQTFDQTLRVRHALPEFPDLSPQFVRVLPEVPSLPLVGILDQIIKATSSKGPRR